MFACERGVIVCHPGSFFFVLFFFVLFVVTQFGLPIVPLARETFSFKVYCVSLCVCFVQERREPAMGVRGGFDRAGHPDPSLLSPPPYPSVQALISGAGVCGG